MKPLLVIIALAFSIQAQTVDNKPPFDDWQFVGQGTNKHGVINVHIAPKTIARDGDRVKVWLMLASQYGNPFQAGWQESESMPDVKFIRVPVTFDCKAKTARNGNISLYSEAGQLTYTYKKRDRQRAARNTELARIEYL